MYPTPNGYAVTMDRDEVSGTGSHIAAQRLFSGIAVGIYLNSADWQELAERGSVSVKQAYDTAPEGAKVVEVTIYQR